MSKRTKKLLLIADACVIMDHGYISGLSWLTQLGQVEVLDVVLAECRHPKQPNLIEQAKAAGIIEVVASDVYASQAATCPYRELSPVDALLMYYAKGEQRILLTNEAPMRNACTTESVEVHGTLWLIEQYFGHRIEKVEVLCHALNVLKKHDRRVPDELVQQLKNKLGC